MKDICVVIPKGLPQAVFESQVKSKFKNLDFKYYAMTSQVSERFGVSAGRVIDIPSNSNVYIRSIFDFFFVFFLNKVMFRKWYIVYDFRGLISEESFLRNGSVFKKRVLGVLERVAYHFSNEVWTVSNNLRDYLTDNFYNRDIKVIPCKVDADWVIKRNLEKPDVINFVYVGSINKWQCFEKTCGYYASIETESTSLTVVTHDTVEANRILSEYNITKCCVKSCSRQEVMQELDKAHFGFVLRENNIVNVTSSPIKLLEYTSRGVIPIMTPFVGDYSSALSDVAVFIDENIDTTVFFERLTDENLGMLYDFTKELAW